MPAGGAAVVLDWGCGDALAADDLAQSCRTLLLYDRADSTRRRLLANFAGRPKFASSTMRSLTRLRPLRSTDRRQLGREYLDRRQFSYALRLFHRLFTSHASLARRHHRAGYAACRPRHDFPAFRLENGFFVAAIIGLARNFVSPYRKLRRDAGYACYTQMQMLGLLGDNGFAGERLKSNIAVSQLRFSYLARKSITQGVSSNDEFMRRFFRRQAPEVRFQAQRLYRLDAMRHSIIRRLLVLTTFFIAGHGSIICCS